ncbi:MAG: exosortase K [Firmicutes bacterium]|nr:exosortase K [Bacillota bacterium]
MPASAIKPFVAAVRQKWPLYLAGFFLIFGLKYFHSKAGGDELAWILGPTARLVGIMSGIVFEREPRVGYLSRQFRFVIAPSCSGVEFMIIAIAALVFSFAHRMRTVGGGFLWLALSLVFSYPYTVFVNGVRIILAVYLPVFLGGKGLPTPERLHTVIGAAVYFTALLIMCLGAGRVSRLIARTPGGSLTVWAFLPPAFWYLAIALGIPVLTGAYKNDPGKFAGYAAVMAAVCAAAVLPACLPPILRKCYTGARKH